MNALEPLLYKISWTKKLSYLHKHKLDILQQYKSWYINFSCALCQVRSKRTKQALVQAFLKQGKLCKSIWYKEHSASTLMCTQDQAQAWRSWCRGQQRNAFKKKKNLFINIFTFYGFFSWQESKSCPCLSTFKFMRSSGKDFGAVYELTMMRLEKLFAVTAGAEQSCTRHKRGWRVFPGAAFWFRRWNTWDDCRSLRERKKSRKNNALQVHLVCRPKAWNKNNLRH